MADLDDLFEGDPEFEVYAADQAGQHFTKDLHCSSSDTYTTAAPGLELIEGIAPSKRADHHVSNEISPSDSNVTASYLMSGALPESAQIPDFDDQKSAKIFPRKAQHHSKSCSNNLRGPGKFRSDSWRRLSSLETFYQDKRPRIFDTVTPTESELEMVDFQLEKILEEIKCRNVRRALQQVDPYVSRQETFRAYRRVVQQYENEMARVEDKSPDLPDSGSESDSGYEDDSSPCEDGQHVLPKLRKDSSRRSAENGRIPLEDPGEKEARHDATESNNSRRVSLLHSKPHLTEPTIIDTQGHHPSVIPRSPQRDVSRMSCLVSDATRMPKMEANPQHNSTTLSSARENHDNFNPLDDINYKFQTNISPHRQDRPFRKPLEPASFSSPSRLLHMDSTDAASVKAVAGSPVPDLSQIFPRPDTPRPSRTNEVEYPSYTESFLPDRSASPSTPSLTPSTASHFIFEEPNASIVPSQMLVIYSSIDQHLQLAIDEYAPSVLQDHRPLLDPQAVPITNASLNHVDQESASSTTTTPSVPTQISDRNPEVQKLLLRLRDPDHNQDTAVGAIPPNLDLQHSKHGIGNEIVPIDSAAQKPLFQNPSSHSMTTTSDRPDPEKTRILLEELRQLAAGTSMQTVSLGDGVANVEVVFQTANLPKRQVNNPAQLAAAMQDVVSGFTSNFANSSVPSKKLLEPFIVETDDICIASLANTQSILPVQTSAAEFCRAKRSQRQIQSQSRENDRNAALSAHVPSRKTLDKAPKTISASVGPANRPSRSIRKVTVNHGIQGDQAKISKARSASNRRSSSIAKRSGKQITPSEIPDIPPLPHVEYMDVDTDLSLPELSTPFQPGTQQHPSNIQEYHKTDADIIMSNTFSNHDETSQGQQSQQATKPHRQRSTERSARHKTPEQPPSKDNTDAHFPHDHDGGASGIPLKTPPRPRAQHAPRTPRSRKQKKFTDLHTPGISSPKKRVTGRRDGTPPIGPLRRSPRIAGRNAEDVGELAM